MSYNFTNSWFCPMITNLSKFLLEYKDKEYHILEIGCHEARSTTWFLDNILTHEKSTITCVDPYLTSDSTCPVTNQTYDLFQSNIEKCKYPTKMTHHKDLSGKVLPELIMKERKFDFIYVDGSHIAQHVLSDAINSWELLKKDGIMWFDDYLGGEQDALKNRPWELPNIAIKAFLSCLNPEHFKVLVNEYQLSIRKLV